MQLKRQKKKDKIYLDMAKNISELSKDKQTKIGCIIVAADGTPVSWGYNGSISGWNDNYIPHSREKQQLSYSEKSAIHSFEDNKYNYMSHAEDNAIDFANKNKLEKSSLYLTQMPCKHCALKIAKHKIARVIRANGSWEEGSTVGDNLYVTKFIFSQANIQLIINGEDICLEKMPF